MKNGQNQGFGTCSILFQVGGSQNLLSVLYNSIPCATCVPKHISFPRSGDLEGILKN